MSLNGVTQAGKKYELPSDVVQGARNGLRIVNFMGKPYVYLGGLLVENTEIFSTIAEGLFKLGLLDTSFYIRGTNGTNPVTGAGSRLAYIPSQRTLYFGSASGTQFDLSSFITHSLILGEDFTPGAGGFNVQHSIISGSYTSSSRTVLESIAQIIQSLNALLVNFVGVINVSDDVNISSAIAHVNGSNSAIIGRSIVYINGNNAATILDSLAVDNGTNTGSTIITRSYWFYHGQLGNSNAKSAVDSFIHINVIGPSNAIVQATRCFYFITNYTGGDLTETDIARFQTGSLVPALKLDIANSSAAVGTETISGLFNLGAGTATRPTIQLSIGTSVSSSLSNNSLSYDGTFIGLRDNNSSSYTLRKSRIIMASGTSFATGSAVAGSIYHCTNVAARNITLPVSSFTNSLGDTIRFKDAAGTAAIANITITPSSGLINGLPNYVINTNYGSVEIYSDGTNFFTI